MVQKVMARYFEKKESRVPSQLAVLELDLESLLGERR
jgi:hypothetical protein